MPAAAFGAVGVGPDAAVWEGSARCRLEALAHWSLGPVLERCALEVLLRAATALMLERPVRVVARSKAARSATVWALLALLGPWIYPHTLLPLVPPDMYGLVAAPTPFLIGVPTLECVEGFLGESPLFDLFFSF